MTEPRRDSATESSVPTGAPEGPRNATVAFERKDVNIRAILAFAVGLMVMIGIALLVIAGLYTRFQDQARKAKSEFPMAEAVRRNLRETDPGKLLPPKPRLDGIVPVSPEQPAGRVLPSFDQAGPENARVLYDAQEQILTSWHGVDEDHPNPRIPIVEAMSRLLAKPGDILKARPGPRPTGRDETADQPSAANSGRGSIGGRK
jgi:hypothetical protein